MLSLTERQLRGWERHDLIRCSETFSLTDLIALRTLQKLHIDRIHPARIKLAVDALRDRLRGVDDPLRELRIIADGRRIRVEIAGQQMEPLSGQLLFNFDNSELRRLLSFPSRADREGGERKRREQAEQWFQKGLTLERSGNQQEAFAAYETAVELDPSSAGAWVNLGTICFHQRQWSRAESFYMRAIEADKTYALAHFNLGNLYDERGDYDRALEFYRQSLALNPKYADAHYNVALLYQGGGHVMEAVRHWKLYLQLDPGSSWAAIARRELDKLRKSALVRPGSRRPTGTRSLD